ncbi:MAG: cyclic nucleotide-binding domain-containing protein [Gammaproteobacteria bacterium]|nr:cyclic nucleotide-binding domain-containing protein [Gammaproteobacteria bacterium]
MTASSILADTPLVKDLSQAELAKLEAIITLRELQEGEILITEGVIDNCLYGIIAGSLAVGRETGDGGWVDFQRLRAGDLLGELGFIDGTAHSASILAVTQTQLFIIQREEFEALVNDEPMLVYHTLRAIIRIVHDILRRMNLQYVEMTNYISKQHGRY